MTVFGNRVKVNTATAGTGTVTLGAAFSNAFLTFAEAGIADGSTVRYCIEEGTNFEIGTGVYTTAGTTLTRAVVTISKISGTAGTSKMTLAGAATVRVIHAKEDVPTLDAANTYTQLQNIELASTGNALALESTDDGSGVGPTLQLNRVSASPAASDNLARITWLGRNSTPASFTYAEQRVVILDPTNGSEDGTLEWRTATAGALAARLNLGGGLFTSGQTDQGAGTINATTLYQNGVALTAEGTFTPTVTLVGGSGNTVPVYITNSGRYQRIGRQCFVDILLDGDGGAEGAGSGTINVALPITASASHFAGNFAAGTSINGATSTNDIVGTIAGGGTTISLTNFLGVEQDNTSRRIRLKFNYEI